MIMQNIPVSYCFDAPEKHLDFDARGLRAKFHAAIPPGTKAHPLDRFVRSYQSAEPTLRKSLDWNLLRIGKSLINTNNNN